MEEYAATPDAPRRLRPHTGLAWLFIILFVLVSLILPRLPQREARPAAADGGVMMEAQAKLLAGGAALGNGRPPRMYLDQAEAMNTGAIGQRQRAIVLIAEIGGPEHAGQRLAELDELIHELAADEGPVELTEEQRSVQQVLRLLYLPEVDGIEDDSRPRVEALTPADRDLLASELGWFGELALVPREGPDQAARDDVLFGPTLIAVLVTLLVIGLILVGFGGFVGLIILWVFAVGGRLGTGLAPAESGAAVHGIYAETFAVWMGLFILLQIGGGIVGFFVQGSQMFIAFIAFFGSLIALAWPVLRGLPWRSVKEDIGLHSGRNTVVEGSLGAAGYAMALPMFAIGVVIAMGFLAIDVTLRQAIGLEGQPLDPEGVPAHPAFDGLAQPGLWPMVQLFLLAVVAAPIVEEIMFRGVFYRHLRDALRPGTATAASVGGAAVMTAFIFAIIHPVPWFAYPALMALAIAFALAREWRGSLVPCIIMHAIHNGMIVTTIMLILSA